MGTTPVDNFAHPGHPVTGEPSVHRWCTRPLLLVIAWLGAFVSLAWCVLDDGDPPGRLLIGVTAVVLAVAAFAGTRARPRLTADPGGIAIGGLNGMTVYAWPQVLDVKIARTRRLGREVSTLEIETFGPGERDVGERLHVFGRLELGADPREVGEV
jgi:hypothetical protein